MADLTEKEVYAGYGKLKDPVKTHTLQQQVDELTKRVEYLESFVKPAESQATEPIDNAALIEAAGLAEQAKHAAAQLAIHQAMAETKTPLTIEQQHALGAELRAKADEEAKS